MINNLAVLFSIAVVAYAMLRAIKLDKMLPWFGRERVLIKKDARR